MKIVILSGLSTSYLSRWQKQFVSVGRNYSESIWRRSEDAENLGDPNCQRRRIIHVIDKYEVLPLDNKSCELAITGCYLWLCSTLPRDELHRYILRIKKSLNKGGWQQIDDSKWQKQDLTFLYKIFDEHPEDHKTGRRFNPKYQTIECTLVTQGFSSKRIKKESPWAVYNSGIRKKGTRVSEPHLVDDLSELIEYLPAQIELGGGASLALGIPPLNYFHKVYCLNAPNGKRFAYGDTDSLLDEVLVDPETFYRTKVSLPYARSLIAKPDKFYRLLAKLHNNGLFVGPVITNNFDGICSLIGLQEMYVRRYEEERIIPDVRFDSRAKSLIVIGSHADRRRVQQAAKMNGLKVIYVDPETYIDYEGKTIPYPLEKIEEDDILCQMTACEFAAKLDALV